MPDPVEPSSAIDLIIEPRVKEIDGMPVRRVLPFVKRRHVGPFVFFDHLGPYEFQPGHGMDVRPHPHIGLATVTWLFEGAVDHRDSLGTIKTIRPGAVNWMTAGKGISHSERSPAPERAAGHRVELIQTWVALPKTHEEQEPSFKHHPAETLPTFTLPGLHGVVLAGEAYGHRSPVEFPWGICQVVITADADAEFETPKSEELAVYVVNGSAVVDGTPLPALQMAVLTSNTVAKVKVTAGTRLMLAGGQALDGDRFMDWNFVSSSKARIDTARADWRDSIAAGFNGSWFGRPPGETSYIPLPGDPQPDPIDTAPM